MRLVVQQSLHTASSSCIYIKGHNQPAASSKSNLIISSKQAELPSSITCRVLLQQPCRGFACSPHDEEWQCFFLMWVQKASVLSRTRWAAAHWRGDASAVMSLRALSSFSSPQATQERDSYLRRWVSLLRHVYYCTYIDLKQK